MKRRPLLPRVAAILLAILAPSVVFIGCAGRLPPPVATDATYSGPELSVDSSGPEHVVMIEAPSPGWVPSLDQVLDALDRRDIFVTLRRPDPRFLYAQQIVVQQVGTGVPSSVPVRVCARIVEFNDATRGVRYPIAARSGANAPAPGGPVDR